MSSVPTAPAQRFRVTPKLAVFTFVGVMLVYVLYHTEHFLIDAADPARPHYRDIGRWLLPHGLVGALALTLSFMQFSARLRTRYPRVHRVCGRIYVAAVFIVAPLGAYISSLDLQTGYTWSFVAASIVFAALWMFATGR
jgi:Predicted membrane protein (DUF2306)